MQNWGKGSHGRVFLSRTSSDARGEESANGSNRENENKRIMNDRSPSKTLAKAPRENSRPKVPLQATRGGQNSSEVP